MRKNILLLLCLVGLIGCIDHDNLYNPEKNPEVGEKPLDVEVPKNMDWSIIQTVTVKVNVDDEYLGKYYYVVEIYDNDPLFSENANLKAAGVAKQGSPFVKNIDIPRAQKKIFIKRTDPRGRSIVGCLEIQEGATSLAYDFAPATGRAAESRAIASRAVDFPNYDKIPDTAIEVTNTTNLVEGQNYKMTANYEGKITHNSGNCKLFIAKGTTWTIPNGVEIETGLQIVVMPGAKIVCAGSFYIRGSSSLIIMDEATVDCHSLSLDNNASVYNSSMLNVGKLTLVSTSSINNKCAIKVAEGLKADTGGSVINLIKGSIEAKNIVFNNVTIHMSDGSMVKAEGLINNMSHTTYIATGEQNLLTGLEISCTSAVVYNGNIVVSTQKHSSGDQYWSPYLLQNGAFLSKDNVTAIETCGGSSNMPDPGHDPKDPDFPLIVKLSDVYTYAMEDQWPTYGDYDMNDVVVRIKTTKTSSTYINKIEFNCHILAVGANKEIAAALQLTDIDTKDVKGVTYTAKALNGVTTNEAITGFNVEGNIEKGHDKLVLPLFANANKLMGSNFLIIKDAGVAPEINIVVDFKDNTVESDDLNYAKIDFFIMPSGVSSGRTEIHLPGYSATNLADQSLIGKGADNGKGLYSSKDNLSWGLLIPSDSWNCPAERQKISEVYPDFVKWLQSGGKENDDWYLNKK